MTDRFSRVQGEPFVAAGMALAPFTANQSASINAFQVSGSPNPLTCGNDTRHHVLVAEIGGGLRCIDCDHTQNFAPAATADWSWRVAQRVAA